MSEAVAAPVQEGPRRLAIVLAGGGARGAYEAGVLSWIFDELRVLRTRPVQVDIICGTSVGAINSAFLAAHLSDSRAGVQKLVDLWENLELDQVLGFSWKQAAALAALFRLGNSTGLVDVAPMARLISRQIPWGSISRTMQAGLLRALCITCTEVYSGRSVLFMQTAPNTGLPTHAPPRTLIRSERIGPQHVLASAAIPILFPAVRVGQQLYMDGGLRHNTPIAPALRLGATHVLVVGTSRQVSGVLPENAGKEPTTAFVLGKIMNALLLDHLDNDLGQVTLVNDLLKNGQYAFGEDFTQRLNQAAAARGGRVVQPAETLIVRPSVALGALGGEYLKNNKIRTNSSMTRRLLGWLDSGSEADLASYLLFDGGYARELIALGRADARAQRDRLLTFLEPFVEGDTGPSSVSGAGWSFPPPAVG